MSRIVILEEDISISEALASTLVSMGHTVNCANSIPGCLTILNDTECDLLIANFFATSHGKVMPTSGASVIIAVRFCNSIKNGINCDPALPIIAISERASVNAIVDPLKLCETLGATGTIQKPVKARELRRVVDKALCA